MKQALVPSKSLFEKLFSNVQKQQVMKILSEIHDRSKSDDNSNLYVWEVDQSIGGIGGYCMPNDPKKNPFPGGEKRELFRPLQYARTEIDLN